MSNIEDRLMAMESRIRRLELVLQQHLPKARAMPVSESESQASGSAIPTPASESGRVSQRSTTRAQQVVAEIGSSDPITATRILGWSGAAALVLAAVYFIRLALDAGWLTPARQVGVAALSGVALIWIGLALRDANRKYASLLPAAGIVILFLTVFGAHLYYRFIGAPFATTSVAGICLLTLWLGGVFRNNLYMLFAVIGAYATPILMPVWLGNLHGLLIYYSAWSLLFCGYAIWQGGRHTYLVAMYLALIGFDFVWRMYAESQWITAAMYQMLQFLIFAVTAAVYSIRHNEPMTREQAWIHSPGLLIFYAVEYAILGTNLPEWAPWIAIASAAVLIGIYWVARMSLREESEAGGMLVAAYAAVVLFHAVYWELIPDKWSPWIAFGVLLSFGVYAAMGAVYKRTAIPILAVLGLIFVLNYLRVVADFQLDNMPAVMLLNVLYAGALYAGYVVISSDSPINRLRPPLLYGAHIASMVAVTRLVDTSLLVSVSWGAIAIGSLFLALGRGDRVLGQSSLLIFAVSGLKVLIYDLDGSAAPVRIGSLVVLGVTLYVGGWLYQRLTDESDTQEEMAVPGSD